ncbi:MAG: hypothetical protein ACRDUT_00125 [Mycobacterium sp.]
MIASKVVYVVYNRGGSVAAVFATEEGARHDVAAAADGRYYEPWSVRP